MASSASDQDWTSIAPLLNFKSDTQTPIELAQDVQLRPWTLADQARDDPHNLMRFMLGQLGPFAGSLNFGWAVSTPIRRQPPNFAIDSSEALAKFDRVLDGLRLLHDELVAYPFVLTGMGTPVRISMGSSGFPVPAPQVWGMALNHPYVLNYRDIGELRSTCDLIDRELSARSDGPLSLALARLSSAHYRWTDADRIIDSAIALETVLLPGSGGEFSYRQAIRGAWLLGGTSDDRGRNFDLFREAYDRRSKIVHGDKDPGKPAASEIMSLTRLVVRSFLASASECSHRELIHRLDLQAVSGL